MIILRNIVVLLVTSVTLNILYNDYFKHDDDENHTPGYRCDCGIKGEFDVSNNVSINTVSVVEIASLFFVLLYTPINLVQFSKPGSDLKFAGSDNFKTPPTCLV